MTKTQFTWLFFVGCNTVFYFFVAFAMWDMAWPVGVPYWEIFGRGTLISAWLVFVLFPTAAVAEHQWRAA